MHYRILGKPEILQDNNKKANSESLQPGSGPGASQRPVLENPTSHCLKAPCWSSAWPSTGPDALSSRLARISMPWPTCPALHVHVPSCFTQVLMIRGTKAHTCTPTAGSFGFLARLTMYEKDKNIGKKLKLDEGKRWQWKNVHYNVLWSVHALYVCHSFDCYCSAQSQHCCYIPGFWIYLSLLAIRKSTISMHRVCAVLLDEWIKDSGSSKEEAVALGHVDQRTWGIRFWAVPFESIEQEHSRQKDIIHTYEAAEELGPCGDGG